MATKQAQTAVKVGFSFAEQKRIERLIKVTLGAPDDLAPENREVLGVYGPGGKHLGDVISDTDTFTYTEALAKVLEVVRTAHAKPAQPQKRGGH